jgi:alkanesulfonate monooxygenase SsuD/methylene tetrahydromethanopterin reductase-like flavin-dependent oxidoreductase (luciferase family)
MKFGINLLAVMKVFPLKLFSDVAVLSEELGYDGYFMADHYNLPGPVQDCLEPFTTLSYLAAKTKKISLGTMVTPVPRYFPPQLAKIVAHVDHLSEGRIILGIGAGWHPPEFKTYCHDQTFYDSSQLVKRTIEGMKLIFQLWTEKKVSFQGEYYSLKRADLEPKPFQKPYPPIWSGGSGDYMKRMAAKYFDGWVSVNWQQKDAGDYKKQVDKVKNCLREFGKDPNKFTFAIQASIGDSQKRVGAFIDAGCNYYVPVIGWPNPLAADQCLPATRKFAKDVMASF